MFVNTIQPVVKPLSNRLSNHLTTGCIVYTDSHFVKPVVQPRLTTGWTNSDCSVNTVVKLVVKPVCQTVNVKPVVQPGLTTGWTNSAVRSTQLSNPFDNRIDNRLDVCLHDTAGCTTGLTTGCIV